MQILSLCSEDLVIQDQDTTISREAIEATGRADLEEEATTPTMKSPILRYPMSTFQGSTWVAEAWKAILVAQVAQVAQVAIGVAIQEVVVAIREDQLRNMNGTTEAI